MFDVGWSELIIIAVVALIAIGPKELPGVLRMVGQWMAKIRRMAADFQGQFNEAMREAEMADIKKQFDDIKDTAKSFTGANLLSDVQKDFDDALKLEDKPTDDKPPEDKPAEPAASDAAASEPGQAGTATPGTEAGPVSEPAPAAEAASAGPSPEGAPEAVEPEPAREPAVLPQAETGAVKAS
ncbi:MAG: Sec-independent protein translocase protein TatB [Xanthobacteraceae bacterium]